MYARNVRIKLKGNCMPEFTRILEQEIIPLLRKQKGFQDEITLIAGKRNEAIAITYWESEEDADAYNHVVYLDALRALSTVVESMPVVETFEIVGSTSHEIAASSA
jgi:heme-degrading monooxygenase HmoA